jgi:hypothetical protein
MSTWPHMWRGDGLNDNLLRGDVEAHTLPSGATAMISKDFEALPDAELASVADKVAGILAGADS